MFCLHRAKSKNGGHHLRQRLEDKGLSLPPGRRKATEISLFTSLVEGEALHLANDYKRLCQNSFPHNELAQIIGAQHVNTTHVQQRIQMVEGAKYVYIYTIHTYIHTHTHTHTHTVQYSTVHTVHTYSTYIFSVCIYNYVCVYCRGACENIEVVTAKHFDIFTTFVLLSIFYSVNQRQYPA